MIQKLMIAAALTALSLSAALSSTPANAQARQVCNHDPVCQAKRDGVSVKQARSRDAATTRCFQSNNATEEMWRANQVSPASAPAIRDCLRRIGAGRLL